MEEASEEKLKEKIAIMRYIETQLGAAQQQMLNLERALIEINTTRLALASIKDLGKDTASLLPLGSGVFARGILTKQEKVLMDIGSGVIVEKTPEEILKLLETKEANVRNDINNIQQFINSLEKQYSEIGTELRKMAKK